MNRTSQLLLAIAIALRAAPVLAQSSISPPPVAESGQVQVQDSDQANGGATDSEPASKSDESPGQEISHFLRLRRDAKGRPIAMETSVTRYIGKNDRGETISVDLIGVVHIGEQEYYERLNRLFSRYDALLYELVAPEGTVIPKGGRDRSKAVTNPIAAMQIGMQSMLELEFQLDHIDYTQENFVHADMSPEEFAASMKQNDESFAGMFFKAIGQSLASSSSGRDTRLIMAMLSGKQERRRVMAEEMQNMESGMIIFQGREGSTIIDHRNAKAMDVLKREIALGKKKLALFYGAGHLPDMQRRLESEFHLRRGGQFWLKAWDLADEGGD